MPDPPKGISDSSVSRIWPGAGESTQLLMPNTDQRFRCLQDCSKSRSNMCWLLGLPHSQPLASPCFSSLFAAQSQQTAPPFQPSPWRGDCSLVSWCGQPTDTPRHTWLGLAGTNPLGKH